ncbi:hypothetical protein EV368DRAFT_84845 [Lentinula lateritia]|uniref:Uncharacterized protein n=1 Tax=Lentinula aff. lateritia TaxID=2804960 RepID=A0ACC1TVK2_9AGAR|nr:hypothetical protein F5876DRAFT_45661 [Lentinula aff. lateritia]KAJ3850130.1 hypothetical protein EV368DRAFT_84845 [Lentinula lateritia]
MSDSTTHKNLLIPRGVNEPTPFTQSVFVLFRALDLPLQYAILSSRSLAAPIIHALGGAPIPFTTAHPLFLMGTNTGLSPQRAILFSMAIGSFIKQSYWVIALSQDALPLRASAYIGSFNALANSLNTVLFTNTATSILNSASVGGDETRLSAPTIVGISLYAIGMLLEWGSELQRLKFKKDPRNKGRVYTGGLFALARHINYGGYVLWRAGFAMAAAGWAWGAFIGGLHTYYFVKAGIPELDDYCSKKYTGQWARYKKAAPYKLIPFVI